MSDIRYDYLTENYVLIAEQRANRPHHFNLKKVVAEDDEASCPFCIKNQQMTPDIIYCSPDQRVRITTNKYPAIASLSGIHEVIIDTDLHHEQLHTFKTSDILTLFKAIKSRVLTLYQSDQIRYIQIFKNKGIEAGASIPHSHWQLMALPFIPNKQKRIDENLNNFYEKNQQYYFQQIYQNKEYIWAENEHFYAYCPYASLYHYAVQIAPKTAIGAFYSLADEMLLSLASVLKTVLNALNYLMPDFSYNICFYDLLKESRGYAQFFVEVIPRSGTMAGFEFATDCFINSMPPEKAAKKLKNIIGE